MNEPELVPRFCISLTNVLLPCYSVSPWELSVNNFRIGCCFADLPFGIPSFYSWNYVHSLQSIIPVVFPTEWEGRKTPLPTVILFLLLVFWDLHIAANEWFIDFTMWFSWWRELFFSALEEINSYLWLRHRSLAALPRTQQFSPLAEPRPVTLVW